MPEYRSVWIVSFLNKEKARSKLGSKYGIDIDEFCLQTELNSQLGGYVEAHKKHGLRTVIQIVMPNQKVIRAVIQEIDRENNYWIIRTARYLN